MHVHSTGRAGAFVGARRFLNQVRRFNMHPTGKLNKGERLERNGHGSGRCCRLRKCAGLRVGVSKDIPLLESITDVARDTTIHAVVRWFWKVVDYLCIYSYLQFLPRDVNCSEAWPNVWFEVWFGSVIRVARKAAAQCTWFMCA